MEFLHNLNYFPSFTTLLVFICTIILFLVILKAGDRKRSNLPPGPPRLPFIGNLHQLLASNPHRRLEQLANKYGPVMHLQLGEMSTIVISSAEAAREVLKTHGVVFANRPSCSAAEVLLYGCKDIAFAPYGDYWRKLRTICMLELLSPKRVQSLRHIREEVMKNCVKSIGGNLGLTIDLTTIILNSANIMISKTAFGIKDEDREALGKAMEEAAHLLSESALMSLFPSLKFVEIIRRIRERIEKALKKNDKILGDIIRDHKVKRKLRRGNEETCQALENEEEDLLDVLLKFEDDARSEFSLTTENIKAVMVDMWGASIDTSTAVIEWAMAEMLKNPKVMQRAQDEVRKVYKEMGTINESKLHELEYLNLVIKETLRLHPIISLIPRESLNECKIFGYKIPTKTKAIISPWAIGRDPKVWTEPEKFNPERFLNSSIDYKGNCYEFIPFGAGRRICPGLAHALAVIQIQLVMFLYHFDWKLPHGMNPADLDMKDSFGISLRRKNVLCVIPTSYHSPKY